MAYNDTPQSYHIRTKYHGTSDTTSKEFLVDYFYNLALNKTQSIFEYKNLPKTIHQKDMELLIQTHGYGVFLRNHENYFCLYGTMGGNWNQDYMPTFAIVANHYLLDVNGAYRIYRGSGEYVHVKDELEPIGDCVIIPNDPLYQGLNDLISIYANRLAETYISRRIVTIMSRYINVFVAKDNNTYKSVVEFLKAVERGDLAAILDGNKIPMLEQNGIYSLPLAANAGSARMLTELIECEQYDKASFYNELGLRANYNMKREAINSNESQLSQDALFPFIDAMLASRKLACTRINECFGLNIQVELSSVWKLTRDEIEASLENLESQAKGAKQLAQGGGDGSDSGISSAGSSIGDGSSDNGE